MAISKQEIEFGVGQIIPVILDNELFPDHPSQDQLRDQARLLGWAVGCPVVERLADPNNNEPGRGPEAMVKRYSEVGFWGGYINRTVVDHLNFGLHRQLIEPVRRFGDEPVCNYEEESVPADYRDMIPATETIAGYHLPRLFIRQLGKDLPKDQLNARLFRANDILDQAVEEAETPEELLALVAEGVAMADVEPLEVLSSTLSRDWYEQQNAGRMLNNAKTALQKKAPTLWQVYTELSEVEKAEHKIA